MTVAQGFGENCDIWFEAVEQMGSAKRESPTGGDFIDNERRAGAVAKFPHAFQKSGLRSDVAGRFHNDGGQVGALSLDNRRQFINLVIRKSECGARKRRRNTYGR